MCKRKKILLHVLLKKIHVIHLEFIGLPPQTQTQGDSSVSTSSYHAESSSGSSSRGGGVPIRVIDGYSMTECSDIFQCLTRDPIQQKHFHKCDKKTQLSTHGIVCCFIITGRCVDVNFFSVCEDLQIRGISPKSDLHTYAVGCTKCQIMHDDVARAIRAAISDKVGIISCSLGLSKISMRPKTRLNDPLGNATFKAFSEGILVCFPAGNKGPEFGTLNYGMPWCLHVGGCSNGKILITLIEVAVKSDKNLAGVAVIRQEGNYYIIDEIKGVSTNLFKNDDDNTFFPLVVGTHVIDKDYLAVFVDQNAGVVYLSSNELGRAVHEHMFDVARRPQAALSRDGANCLLGWLRRFRRRIHVRILPSKFEDDKRPPHVLELSSRGPANPYDEIIMPNIVAPGCSILTGWPRDFRISKGTMFNIPQSEQCINTGTSFSNALAAGCMSYLKGCRPDLGPWSLISAVMITARSLGPNTPENEFAFGGGILNVQEAVTPGLIYEETVKNVQSYRSGSLSVDALNLPSIAASFNPAPFRSKRTFWRRLTNDDDGQVNYAANILSMKRGHWTLNQIFR